jgi:hypothetical protein
MYTRNLAQSEIEALDAEDYSNFLVVGDPEVSEFTEEGYRAFITSLIERLKEDLLNLPTRYPDPTVFRSPFYEEEDDN